MDSLLNDLKASLVVFLVALPLCLGLALASNAPLSSGIIAGILATDLLKGIFAGFNLVRVNVDVHELIREYHDEAKKKNKIVSFN